MSQVGCLRDDSLLALYMLCCEARKEMTAEFLKEFESLEEAAKTPQLLSAIRLISEQAAEDAKQTTLCLLHVAENKMDDNVRRVILTAIENVVQYYMSLEDKKCCRQLRFLDNFIA